MAPFFENFGMDNIWEEIPARHGRAQVPLHVEVTRMEVVVEEEEEEAEAVEQSEDESIDESDYVFDYEFDYGSET